MGWAVAELTGHPERVEKIRTEMLEADADRSLTLEQTSKLGYTHAFIREVLRLHPPAIWSGRRVVNDFEIHGRTIAGGAMILFIPFEGGNRRCLGFALATQELLAMTARLARRTDLELIDGGPQRHVGTMSSAPERGTPVRVRRVEHNPCPNTSDRT